MPSFVLSAQDAEDMRADAMSTQRRTNLRAGRPEPPKTPQEGIERLFVLLDILEGLFPLRPAPRGPTLGTNFRL